MHLGDAPPKVESPIPAEVGKAWVERLAASECPALTTRRKRRAEQTGANHDPIVWVEAKGCNVVDADGNRYVDLTSGFGVAFIGHGHPKVVHAVQDQATRLLQALGDLHPSSVKIELLERLCTLAPWPDARAMLSLSGADAVTAALKTAMLATGRPGVVTFEGSYHGLSYGPLAVSRFSDRFRAPFEAQLGIDTHVGRWPERDADVNEAIASLPTDWSGIGALILEPVQGRAGVRVPPARFLVALGEICAREGVVLIADEIFTGLGRCGAWWRSADQGLVPDVVCLGKALGGGLPVSACLGREEVMRAWGNPDREAIHTGTFFGDPLGAAAALATLRVVEDEELVSFSQTQGRVYAEVLERAGLPAVREVRQAGLMLGLQLDAPLRGLELARALLEEGYLVLPAGVNADVLHLVPPVTMTAARFEEFVGALSKTMEAAS